MAHFPDLQPQAFQTRGNQHIVTCAPLQRHKELLGLSPVLTMEGKNAVPVKNLSDQKGSFTTAENVTPAGFTGGSPPKMTGPI